MHNIESAEKTPVVFVRLLIVNDEEDALYTTRSSLEKAGFHVTCFQKPLEALQNFRPCVYDMVLINIHMPEMDGLTLFRKMHAIDPSVKVCFLTASSDKDEILEKLKNENGFPVVSHLRMPVSPRQIVSTVKQQVGVSLL